MYMRYDIMHLKGKNEYLSPQAILIQLEIAVLNEMLRVFKVQ